MLELGLGKKLPHKYMIAKEIDGKPRAVFLRLKLRNYLLKITLGPC